MVTYLSRVVSVQFLLEAGGREAHHDYAALDDVCQIDVVVASDHAPAGAAHLLSKHHHFG